MSGDQGAPHGAMLITGGAGFIGSNLARALLKRGWPVIVFDNLSRAGVEHNAAWLKQQHSDRITLVVDDIRDAEAVRRCVQHAPLAGVFHFAAQVAVTDSLTDPRHDFEVNVGGTLNLLEALRELESTPPLIYTSSNKVYGGLAGLLAHHDGTRYVPVDPQVAAYGIDESCCLDFRSPYGCSKGAADQYVLDYARTFGMPAVVFRMSCIFGPRQFGTEDQGWIAHFLLRTLAGDPITVFGDGAQVRDALFVDDLVRALLLAHERLSVPLVGAELAGQAFNIGGGPGRAVSLLELCTRIEALTGRAPQLRFAEWRPGDQRYFVSDTRKFAAMTGWAPREALDDGLAILYRWLLEHGAGLGIACSPGSGYPVGAGCGVWQGGRIERAASPRSMLHELALGTIEAKGSAEVQ